MAKLDLKKTHKQLFAPKEGVFTVLDIPEFNYLMIDGEGDPNTSPQFKDAFSLLYGVAYTIKFMISKRDKANDYVVPPPEGLWWSDNMASFCDARKDEWKWTLILMQPEFVTPELFAEGVENFKKKKKITGDVPVRLEALKEGKVVQTMYLGSYADEGPVIASMHAYIKNNGYALTGKHHEIYLNDPQRVAPEKLKTILRQPIR